MPRAPAFKIDALADLLRQLEYAPPETRKRQMDAAERLAGDIEPDLAYPREFVIYRITGYRQEFDELVTFAGAALRTDLCNLVQRLSDSLDLPPMRGGKAALALDEVSRRLSVSAKTIQRYRREGLVCHVVVHSEGRKQLACYEDALERFAAVRPGHLQKASRFTRISGETEALIIEEARWLREARPISLSSAARIIARKHGRAHETIRQMLRRHDESAPAGEAIFAGERGPLSPREIAVLLRAWQRGVELGPMARRFGRSRAAIVRAVNRRRAELLRGLNVQFLDMPTFALEGADSVILSAPELRTDLLALPPHDEALALLEWAGLAEAPAERVEVAMLAGWNFLKRRAAAGINCLAQGENPTSEALDAIETDLRWATRLHRRLALLAFPSALRRIEINLGRSLTTQPAEQIAGMIRLSALVIREALEGIDPSRGHRLDRIVAFAVERTLAQREPASTAAAKAAARHASGAAIPLRGAFDRLDEWDGWLDPWRQVRDRSATLPETSRQLLIRRFGWDGQPPQTMLALARELHRNEPATVRALQKAIRELRAAVRITPP